MNKKIHEQYLEVVGKGFTFNSEVDLSYVASEKEFLDNLSHDQIVDLVEGLDSAMEGSKSKTWREKLFG